jgi:hypothetical protein
MADRHRDGPLAAGGEHHLVARREAIEAQRQAPETVVVVGIGARQVDHQFWAGQA